MNITHFSYNQRILIKLNWTIICRGYLGLNSLHSKVEENFHDEEERGSRKESCPKSSQHRMNYSPPPYK